MYVSEMKAEIDFMAYLNCSVEEQIYDGKYIQQNERMMLEWQSRNKLKLTILIVYVGQLVNTVWGK